MEKYKFFLIPLLMLSDYFLTVLGARMAAKKYRQHFNFPDYELNPMFQKHIAQKRWFNPRHLIIVALFAVFCFFWPFAFNGLDWLSEGLFGYLVTVFGTVNGVHLANILTFRHLERHPEQLSGEVKISQKYMLSASQFRTVSLLVPFGLAAIFSPSPFLIGGVVGLVMLLVIKSKWLRKERGKPPPIPANVQAARAPETQVPG